MKQLKVKSRDNVNLVKTLFTLERGLRAQELSDQGWSNDRIAAEIGVTRHVIEKWNRQKLIKQNRRSKPNSSAYRETKKKMIILAQKLLDKGATAKEIAQRAKLNVRTIYEWKREG